MPGWCNIAGNIVGVEYCLGGANTKRKMHQEFRLNKNNTKYGWSLIVGPTTGIAIVIERVEYVCYKCKDSLQNTANRSISHTD